MGISIDADSRAARLFFWALRICERFVGRDIKDKYEEGSNICHFIRVTFVYMPLILLSHILLAASIVYGVFILPILWFGISGYLSAVAIMIGITIGSVGIIIVAILIGNGWSDYAIKRRNRKLEIESQDDSLGKVVTAWIIAKKQKICPMIEFERRKNNA